MNATFYRETAIPHAQVGSAFPHRSNAFARPGADVYSSAAFAAFAVAIISSIFALTSEQFQHWFLIPISICGVLIGSDAVDWFRGRLDLYDPAGLLGILGFHFFYLAPLLHVKWDFWMREVSPPPDWRNWLGYMGLLNVVGLACYRICRDLFAVQPGPPRTYWEINKQVFRIFVPICLIVSIAAQVWVYARMGGISGYMDTRLSNPSAFEGLGWIFMVSESAPILAAFLVIVQMRRGRIRWSFAFIALLALFVLQMFFGGLRGSRSETVQLLFWVVGCVHFLVRPVPRKVAYAGCAFIFVFMYFYGFYKDLGVNATEAFSNSDQRELLAEQTGRTSEALVLGDMGRADVQSFILYRLVSDRSDYTYAYGRTYLGALALLIPHWILPERPETKIKEGTEIETGTGGYIPGELWSSRVYGLAGESMLNFGPFSVPVAYAIFGLLVGWFRSDVQNLMAGDSRFLLVPFGVYMCLAALSGDSDNLIFGLAKDGLMPLLVVLFCSLRRKIVIPSLVAMPAMPQRTVLNSEQAAWSNSRVSGFAEQNPFPVSEE